jgi:hypothetical protein
MFAESALRPNNLQDSFERSLGHTDASYTAAVDNGSYTRTQFINDRAGYGLVQWTFSTRKAALFDFAKSRNSSIGDLRMQLDFMWQELQSFRSTMDALRNATNLLMASNAVVTQYLKPAGNNTPSVQERRAGFGQGYFDRFSQRQPVASAAASFPYTVRVIGDPLNIRTGPGTNHDRLLNSNGVSQQMRVGTELSIVEESDGQGATRWGRLSDRQGWVALDFTVRL